MKIINFLFTIFFLFQNIPAFSMEIEEEVTKNLIKQKTIAAKQGNADAQFWMGKIHYDGNGVEKDKEEAFKWYKLAADQRHAESQFCVGNCYYFSDGVKKSFNEAFGYYKLAADQGHPQAKSIIKKQNSFANKEKKEYSSLEVEEDTENSARGSIFLTPSCCRSDEECGTHWGLKHWFYGIKEYIIDRCLCCTLCGFNHMDEDRAYKADGFTTDCCYVGFTPWCRGDLHNNPVTGTLCFPLATTIHLLCLPYACCVDSVPAEMIDKHNKKKEKEKEKLKIYEYKPSSYSVPNYAGLSHSTYTALYGGCPDTCTDKNHKSFLVGKSCKCYRADDVAPMFAGAAYVTIRSYPEKYCDYCGKIHKLDESWVRLATAYGYNK